MSAEDAPDTAPAGDGLDDHNFSPPDDARWGLCEVCGFGQAAHNRVPKPYVSKAPRAPEGAARPGDPDPINRGGS